ncbi:uncharacterized protein METZ01_LOCUS258182 [marine metagenome]|uniref:Uncharacterized protein n=1 Tax=marine metagenome TaxID=408172 RepID=A0A382J0J8_9ZZZZ
MVYHDQSKKIDRSFVSYFGISPHVKLNKENKDGS